MAQKKETPEQKYNRLLKLDKDIKKQLKNNHAGIFAVPNPITKTTHLMIMDIDDLEKFNSEVQENIKQMQEEEKTSQMDVQSTLEGNGDVITNKKIDEA